MMIAAEIVGSGLMTLAEYKNFNCYLLYQVNISV